MLIKAYLRRGLAYETVERYKPAVNDLMRVRELQPMNKQAQQGIQRCQKYIKQDEGESYIPNDEDISLPDLPELKSPTNAETSTSASPAAAATPAPVVEEVKKAEPVKTEPVKTEPVPQAKKEEPKAKAAEPTPAPKEEPKKETAQKADDGADFSEIEDKIAALKEKGNNQFRKKSYKEAVKHFSEAIKIFEETGRPITKGDIKTKITQIYTNRATSLHLLNQQSSVISDATFVIDHLDDTNKKALYRRAHAFKIQGQFEEAARDL